GTQPTRRSRSSCQERGSPALPGRDASCPPEWREPYLGLQYRERRRLAGWALSPSLPPALSNGDRAVEVVGIGKQHRGIRAIDLQQHAGQRRIKREHGLSGLTGL